MDGLLHLGLKILNAHAEAVESEATQSFQMRAAGDTRVDFNSDFGVRRKKESLARVCEEVFELRGRKIRGSAAAPVELNYRAFARNHSRDVVDFLLERGEIGNRDALILLNRDVARAKKAEAFAEGKMHVERERRASQIGGGVTLFEIVRAEIVLPDRSRGIAGVARAGAIVFGEKLFGDLTDVEPAIAAGASGFCRGSRRD